MVYQLTSFTSAQTLEELRLQLLAGFNHRRTWWPLALMLNTL